jgi:16S rRNA (guanine527-N7)-methyltransferase
MTDGLVGPDPVGELRGRVKPWVAQTLDHSATLGFLGPMPVAEQIEHALGFVYAFEAEFGRSPNGVLDLGSGGGVPGLVLASCWPGGWMLLLDSNSRRTEFVLSELGPQDDVEKVEVVTGRAEEVGRDPRLRGRLELVTARSFGAPAVAAECGAPFLAVGGVMIVSEPPGDRSLDRWPAPGLVDLGLEPSTKVRFNDAFGFQVLLKTAETSSRFPRRIGVPTKRPLF